MSNSKLIILGVNFFSWDAVDILGSDRPYNLSEFTALPLYSDENSEDPSSVVVWGGYVEHDTWSDERWKSDGRGMLRDTYGLDWEQFELAYLSRLVRFDVATNVWKNLKPTTDILPKALSFACVDKCEDGVLRLLVGGGYGFTPSKLDQNEKQQQFTNHAKLLAAMQLCTLPSEGYYPQGSNKMYEVAITECFGNMYGVKKSRWCWDLYNLSTNERPQLKIDTTSPWSSTVGVAVQESESFQFALTLTTI